MSSRVFVAGEWPEEVAPIRWRMADQEESTLGPRASPPEPAGPRSPEPAGVPVEEVEAQLAAAYQKGIEEGRGQAQAAAQQAARQQLAPVLENLSSAAQQMTTAGARIRKESEAMLVKLAIAIARRTLHREIQTDPEAILGLVRSAFDRLDARETHQLRLAPSEAAVVNQNRAALLLPERLEIVSDPSLPPGSAIFETSRGEMDASVMTQLDEIERGFADLVRRRSHA